MSPIVTHTTLMAQSLRLREAGGAADYLINRGPQEKPRHSFEPGAFCLWPDGNATFACAYWSSLMSVRSREQTRSVVEGAPVTGVNTLCSTTRSSCASRIVLRSLEILPKK